jgi:hypothetical protein
LVSGHAPPQGVNNLVIKLCPTFPINFLCEIGLNLFLKDLLSAEPPRLVHQFLVGTGSISAK